MLEECLGKYESRIQNAGLELELHCPSKPLRASIDATRLAQLFDNLLENSLRYTERGGKIRVSCEPRDREILVIVDDSEPSVPDDALPRLFDRLYRVERSRGRRTGGAGLGLTICRNIAEAHGGTISVSKSGLGGLRVELRLPADVTMHA